MSWHGQSRLFIHPGVNFHVFLWTLPENVFLLLPATTFGYINDPFFIYSWSWYKTEIFPQIAQALSSSDAVTVALHVLLNVTEKAAESGSSRISPRTSPRWVIMTQWNWTCFSLVTWSRCMSTPQGWPSCETKLYYETGHQLDAQCRSNYTTAGAFTIGIH